MEPWRAAAIQRGYRSGIALPLKDDREQVFGVLLIYSAEPNAITPSEIRLLEELANDLAFGIVTLRTREERRRAEGELLRINRFLLTLSRCNEILIHASDEQALLQQMCRIVIEVGEFAMAWIGYVDNGIVHKMAQFGAQADAYLGTATLMTGEENGEQCRPALRAAQTGEIQVIQDMTQAECSQWQARALDYGYRSAIALPLMAGANVIGTFNIYASDSGGFGTQEVTLLSEMANDIGYGIETLRVRHDHQQFVERLQASMESTIQALASAVELRDPYTAGHQRRVAQLSVAVSRSMGWTEEQTQVVYLAGVVHDIGKIAVPAEILSKPGRLSETEMMLVREHASAGYDILRPVDFPWPIAQIVLQHHERMDGSGYPQGLQGDAILPEARILAVCDVVEAMTTHRPYRPGLGFDVALQEIESGRGTAFDPEVVDACVRVIRDERFAF
jgi:putative nucleotidyltransferase with HDIG domain